LSEDDRPVVVLRVAPRVIDLRASRVEELERVIGSRPIVGTMNERSVDAIVDEAHALRADVIVLDYGSNLGAEVATHAKEHDTAVVIAPRGEHGTERYGRGQNFTFHGYERVNERGELTPLRDGELRAEIEQRRERHRYEQQLRREIEQRRDEQQRDGYEY
jgi:hypothetical protein